MQSCGIISKIFLATGYPLAFNISKGNEVVNENSFWFDEKKETRREILAIAYNRAGKLEP